MSSAKVSTFAEICKKTLGNLENSIYFCFKRVEMQQDLPRYPNRWERF